MYILRELCALCADVCAEHPLFVILCLSLCLCPIHPLSAVRCARERYGRVHACKFTEHRHSDAGVGLRCGDLSPDLSQQLRLRKILLVFSTAVVS